MWKGKEREEKGRGVEEVFQIKISLYCVAPVANVSAKDGVIYQDKKQRQAKRRRDEESV